MEPAITPPSEDFRARFEIARARQRDLVLGLAREEALAVATTTKSDAITTTVATKSTNPTLKSVAKFFFFIA
jgi:hypothetical protein